MKVTLGSIQEFDRNVKRLAKKYRSIYKDLHILQDAIKQNPMQGIPLGFGGVHKIRMAITSKGGGKSGGARVITYSVTQDAPDEYQVTLLSIYDKGEIENLTNTYIQSLVERAK